MHRNALKHLTDWFQSPRRKPLVLRGARQVGKSTLVRLFAKEADLTLFELNLERQLQLTQAFKSRDMRRIIAELEGLTGEFVNRPDALLFLDEVQAIPEAIQCLRYFHEDYPNLAVVAAGSLLEFALSENASGMPVGRVIYSHLGPMSFEEFLRVRDPELHEFLRRMPWREPIADSRHQNLLLRQREYLVTGGMPEAVAAFCESGSFKAVQQVQGSIVDTYIDDFAKYAQKGELARLQKVYRSLPMFVGRKIQYTKLAGDERSAETRKALDLLVKAKLYTRITHSHCSGLPLRANAEEGVFKLAALDCGLLNYQLGLQWPQVQAMDERQLVNEGALAEQFVAQELLAGIDHTRDPELFYWLREARSGNAELDFVVSRGLSIIPVEVKSGKSGTLKSLRQFVQEKKAPLGIRFDLNQCGFQKIEMSGTDFNLLSLPLYLCGRLSEILDELQVQEGKA